ncbi:uncharacterized protein LOC106459037 isoform X2 [Limulus polyphemus]|uniref:Uncharacterized protein LOC106459037 isoform X2 n=1 Tax=Limulus polyphemus TaxID=6850 RepID=A0ABM1SBW5_LIMPO|nr:uncharacterized protein LOC106459037 isoform X2 [Limulus polyphemus]
MSNLYLFLLFVTCMCYFIQTRGQNTGNHFQDDEAQLVNAINRHQRVKRSRGYPRYTNTGLYPYGGNFNTRFGFPTSGFNRFTGFPTNGLTGSTGLTGFPTNGLTGSTGLTGFPTNGLTGVPLSSLGNLIGLPSTGTGLISIF